MISPPVSVTSQPGADLNRTSSRRRGLSYLRALSHSRSSGGTSPNEASRSPRHYFQRSHSYNDTRPDPSTATRRRSASRPNEPTTPLAIHTRLIATSQGTPRPSSPLVAGHPAPETADQVDVVSEPAEQNTDEMARQRSSMARRNTNSNQPMDDAAAERSDSGGLRPPNLRRMTTGTKGDSHDGEAKHQLPTIRFFPHQEMRNGRPSLTFTPISRTLPNEHAVIRVGRYSEREGIPEANPSTPSDAPVGFKSKVVSRKHCEFSFVDGQWQIRDVASSSGTFLNHIRLSQPNTESKLFPIKDGDIVQLGIDFRGGEEMIFRCVKIRIECNRSWQKKPNNFNKSRHQQLQSLAKDQASANANSGECAICLGSVLPCQALFVAPCAHCWHYKCIRPLLEGRNSLYPQFQCPNCRAYTDLTADVDIAQSDIDEWMENADDAANQTGNENGEAHNETDASVNAHTDGDATDEQRSDDMDAANDTGDVDITTTDINLDPAPELTSGLGDRLEGGPSTAVGAQNSGLLARRQASNPSSTGIHSMNGNLEMPQHPDEDEMDVHLEHTRTQTPDIEHINPGEGPLTPRNNAGPFVFDGSAGRSDAGHLSVPGNSKVTDGSERSQ
ncbi:E3 ubiquitin-protein ligase DMA2 [Exophiala dermatitidis]